MLLIFKTHNHTPVVVETSQCILTHVLVKLSREHYQEKPLFVIFAQLSLKDKIDFTVKIQVTGPVCKIV